MEALRQLGLYNWRLIGSGVLSVEVLACGSLNAGGLEVVFRVRPLIALTGLPSFCTAQERAVVGDGKCTGSG